MKFILTVIVNMLSFAVITSGLFPGIRIAGEWPLTLLITATLFALINAIVKPILKFLTCPFILLSLGLFLFVINAGLLLLTAGITGWADANLQGVNGQLQVDTFGWALGGSIVLSILNVILGKVVDLGGIPFRRRPTVNAVYVVQQQRTDLDAQFEAYVRSQQAGQNYPPQQPYYPQGAPPQPPPGYPPQGGYPGQPSGSPQGGYPPQYPPNDPQNPYGAPPPPRR
jgi:putative membrane protein